MMARLSTILALAVTFCVSASGFVLVSPTARATLAVRPSLASSRTASLSSGQVMRMSEEVDEVVAETPADTPAEVDPASTFGTASFFAPNPNTRRGASRDQDGKSNVWAMEPSMEVEGGDVVEGEGVNKFVLAGGVLGAGLLVVALTVNFLPSPGSL